MKNKTSTIKVWRIKLDVPPFCVSEVESILTHHCASISLFWDEQKKIWNIEGLSEKKLDLVFIKHHLNTVLKNFTPKLSPTIDTLTPSHWLKNHVLTFCPIQLGRFRIKGETFNENKNINIFDICLNAGTAFGSGKHPTTALCILALDRFAKKKNFSRILDLGCGSGILSIAAAKLWRTRVFAADIDPEAVRVTSYNVKLNGVSHLVSPIPTSTNLLASTRDRGPYDLIVANILTVPLITISQTLLAQLLPQGIIVVSGFLTKDINRLLNAFCSRHIKVLYKKTQDDWVVIALKNSRNLQNCT